MCAFVARMTRAAQIGPFEVSTVQIAEEPFSELQEVAEDIEETGVHEWSATEEVFESRASCIRAVQNRCLIRAQSAERGSEEADDRETDECTLPAGRR